MDQQRKDVSIESVRAVVAGALGDGRLDSAAADAPLVRSGLISSLEIVTVSLALEDTFGISIPPALVTVANFDTLVSLVRLVEAGGSGSGPAAAADGAEWSAFRARAVGVVRRPLLFAVFALSSLLFLDWGFGALMRGPFANSYDRFMESGHRLYPIAGGYSQDDLGFAVAQHRILHPSGGAGPRVAFFGDSGTIGSFVRYEDAIPHALEDAMRQRYPGAEVYNLAFFMQFLAKDLMILEAVLAGSEGRVPFDVAIFTLGDDYFKRDFVIHLEGAMPYLSLNWPLLAHFTARLPESERGPFQSMDAELQAASRRMHNPLEEFLQRYSALYHYAPYFRYLVTEVLRSAKPYDYPYSVGRKPLFNPVPATPPANFLMSLGIAGANVDARIESMTRATVAYLKARGVRVVLYLKPHGPNEWRTQYQPTSALTAKEISERLCEGGDCSVVDLRWEISGSEFTDTIAHYTADANRRIGNKLARAILEQVRR